MKLITLSQFVLEKDEQIRKGKIDAYCFTMSVTDYALFLQRPLELGMFIPCDDQGNVLQEPTDMYNSPQYYEAELGEYLSAKEKILFIEEGFKQNPGKEKQYFKVLEEVYDTIESFIDYEDIELTEIALEESRLITLI